MKEIYLRNRLCIPIKGYNRSIIYDLNRRDYYFISNELYDLINTDEEIDLDKNISLSIEWKNFLLEEEIIFPIESPLEKALFPKLSLDYKSEDLLTNLIIHENIDPKILSLFDSLYLKNISILINEFNPESLNILIEKIKILEVDSISIFVKEGRKSISIEEIKLLQFPDQIITLYSFSNKENSKEKIYKKLASINYEKLACSFEDYISYMQQSKSQVNNLHFLESLNFHNYFNQKLYIDESGNLKNGLNTSENFGNINNMTNKKIVDIIESSDFQKLWNVKKQKTLVCEDCEFKNMCVDPRVPITSRNGKWYHTKECSYNPYLSIWSDDKNYKNLHKSGVTIHDGEITINETELRKNFESIYNNKYASI